MSLKKTSEGLWRTDFYANGKRIRETFPTRQEARDFETQTKITAKLGVAVVGEDRGEPLNACLEEYFQIHGSKKQSSKKIKLFLAEFYRFMVVEYGVYYIREIRLIHLSSYQAFLQSPEKRFENWQKFEAMRKKAEGDAYEEKPDPRFVKLSNTSVNKQFTAIKPFFKWSKRWEWIESNIALDISRLPSDTVRRKPWPSDVLINKAIELAKPWASKPFYFIAKYGTRPIAVCRWTWSGHINFETRELKVTSLKGDGSMREHWIPMADEDYDIFLEMKAQIKNVPVGADKDLVFHSSTHLPLDPNELGKEMARVTKKMNLKGYTLYGFRHHFVTVVANPSKDGKRTGNLEAARILAGHSDIRQTTNYNHAEKEFVRAQFDKVNKERRIVLKKDTKAKSRKT